VAFIKAYNFYSYTLNIQQFAAYFRNRLRIFKNYFLGLHKRQIAALSSAVYRSKK